MRHVVALGCVIALAAACGSPTPSAVPSAGVDSSAAPQTAPAGTSATPAPTGAPPAVPGFTGESASHYLIDAGHPIVLRFGADETTWTPRMPAVADGAPAVRFGLLPATCPAETDAPGESSTGVAIEAATKPDAWDTGLRAEPMTGVWSVAPEPTTCIDGELRGSIRGIGFYPIAGNEDGVRLSAGGHVAPGETMSLVPIYSDLDVEHPSFQLVGTTKMTLGAPRADPILTTTTAGTRVLPDRSIADHANVQLTGCTSPAKGVLTISMRVDGGASVELASCSDGGYSAIKGGPADIELAGTDHTIEVFATGSTEGVTVRVSEFAWREQP